MQDAHLSVMSNVYKDRGAMSLKESNLQEKLRCKRDCSLFATA